MASLFAVEPKKEILHLHCLEKSLSLEHAGKMEQELQAAISQTQKMKLNVINLDLMQVLLINSLIIGILAAFHTKMKDSNIEIRISNCNKDVRSLFRITRLDQAIKIQ